MTIKFESPAEAFVAVATVVISVDKIGSLDERKFLFERIKSLAIFDTYNDAEFGKLLATVNEKVYETLPIDDLVIAETGIYELGTAARAVLASELLETAFTMACELACSDSLAESEKTLLQQIQQGLGIESKVTHDCLGETAVTDPPESFKYGDFA